MGGYSFYPDKPISQYKKSDTGLIVSIILMWGIGICALFVCSSSYCGKVFGDELLLVKRQLFASAVGLGGLLFFAFAPLSTIRRMLPLIMLVCVLLLLATFVPALNEERNGAKRWVKLPFFRFQPSELAKFAIILYLANFFDKYQRDRNIEERSVFPAVVVMSLFVILIFAERDFSTGLFLFLICLLLFFISGIKTLWLIPMAVIGIPALAMMIVWEPYRMERIAGYLHPEQFSQGVNYQTNASLRAIGAGGFWGQGIGNGLIKLNSIPEVQADYIFAGWTEAMGFVGVALYFIILCVFAYRAYKISINCPDRFGAIGTFGCISSIFFQSLANLAVVCGAIPSTGIPLPFFSAGGSSMIVTMSMCGFMINAAREDGDSGEGMIISESDDDDLEVLNEAGVYERL
ncbi:MAG: putative lipid II flippase FtsW [Treponema sp.]|nr:putative lipid II flippase FtsW [Treponema sp.]